MKWKREDAQEIKEHYKALFGPKCSASGQAVFLDLFDKSGMARTNFVPGEPDQSSFNDGLRSLFLHILQMAYEPDQIVDKIKETSTTEYI